MANHNSQEHLTEHMVYPVNFRYSQLRDIFFPTIIFPVNVFMTETASEILGKGKAVIKPWVITDILNLCDERRALKKGRHETVEGAEKYRAVNQEIKKSIKKAKESWIDVQCRDIEDNVKKNNSKKRIS